MFLALSGDLQVGAFLEKRDLMWRGWNGNTDELELSRYFVEGVAKVEGLVGGVLRVPVKSGDFLQSASFVRPGDTAFLAAGAQGRRAPSRSRWTRSAAAPGLIQPGSHVDVILAGRLSSTTGDTRRLMCASYWKACAVIALSTRRVERPGFERVATQSRSPARAPRRWKSPRSRPNG